jgi:hypothetical protein
MQEGALRRRLLASTACVGASLAAGPALAADGIKFTWTFGAPYSHLDADNRPEGVVTSGGIAFDNDDAIELGVGTSLISESMG